MSENHTDALIKVLKDIIVANREFRAQMPEGWEGDPLQDACDAARSFLDTIETPRTAPPYCTACHDETDCANIAICRATVL